MKWNKELNWHNIDVQHKQKPGFLSGSTSSCILFGSCFQVFHSPTFRNVAICKLARCPTTLSYSLVCNSHFIAVKVMAENWPWEIFSVIPTRRRQHTRDIQHNNIPCLSRGTYWYLCFWVHIVICLRTVCVCLFVLFWNVSLDKLRIITQWNAINLTALN